MGPPMTQPPKEIAFLKSAEVLKAFNSILEEDLHQRIVIESNVAELYSPVFIVQKSSGKQRLIISCKYVNLHLQVDHFRMEGLLDIQKILQ
ncbi:MAG: hypothetical protein EZS28_051503, partial [Streblomastix strix]